MHSHTTDKSPTKQKACFPSTYNLIMLDERQTNEEIKTTRITSLHTDTTATRVSKQFKLPLPLLLNISISMTSQRTYIHTYQHHHTYMHIHGHNTQISTSNPSPPPHQSPEPKTYTQFSSGENSVSRDNKPCGAHLRNLCPNLSDR